MLLDRVADRELRPALKHHVEDISLLANGSLGTGQGPKSDSVRCSQEARRLDIIDLKGTRIALDRKHIERVHDRRVDKIDVILPCEYLF